MRSPFRYTPSGPSVARKGCWGIEVGGPNTEYTSGINLVRSSKEAAQKVPETTHTVLLDALSDQRHSLVAGCGAHRGNLARQACLVSVASEAIPIPAAQYAWTPTKGCNVSGTLRYSYSPPLLFERLIADFANLIWSFFWAGVTAIRDSQERIASCVRPARSSNTAFENQAPAICGSRIRASSQQVMASSRRPSLAPSPPLLSHQPAAFGASRIRSRSQQSMASLPTT